MSASERTLVIGGGGREHAISWALKRSHPEVDLFIAPGNAGTADVGINIPIGIKEPDKAIDFAVNNRVDLIIVGPEAALQNDVAGEARRAGIPVVGPNERGAKIETSKAYGLDFARRHKIPHAQARAVRSVEEAQEYVQEKNFHEVVVKRDGLAEGKGVFLPKTSNETWETIEIILESDDRVIIQERLYGPELSAIAVADGETIVPLIWTRDYKRLRDNDQGPNTGGMGAFASQDLITPQLARQIQTEFLEPTVLGLRKDGVLYRGVIYIGLILTPKGPRLIEYNARFGDPETQVQMMQLASDPLALFKAVAGGGLRPNHVSFRKGVALTVGLVSEGYPEDPKTGRVIEGLGQIEESDEVVLFHGATKRERDRSGERTVTSGGRSIWIGAWGENVKKAREIVYENVHRTRFEGAHYRTDIGES